jgi:hypothetical protein
MADNRQIAERYLQCALQGDLEGMAELLHPDSWSSIRSRGR